MGYRANSHTITPALDAMVEDGIQTVLDTACPRVVFSPLLPIEGENGAARSRVLTLWIIGLHSGTTLTC